MSNSITEIVQQEHGYDARAKTITHKVPACVEVEVPVAISERAIVEVLTDWYSRPDAEIGADEDGGCKFRADRAGSDQRRCAFGVFIPDAVYDRAKNDEAAPDIEGWSVGCWTERTEELAYLRPHTDFLVACQKIHDNCAWSQEYDLSAAQTFVVKLRGFAAGRESLDPEGYTALKFPSLNTDDNPF